jgi:hypothetical protein
VVLGDSGIMDVSTRDFGVISEGILGIRPSTDTWLARGGRRGGADSGVVD